MKFIKNLIIGPQKNIDEVRKDLLQLGFIINKEAIVKENNKYYFIIHLIHGIGVSYSDDELQFGYNVINKELQKEYVGKIATITYVGSQFASNDKVGLRFDDGKKFVHLLNLSANSQKWFQLVSVSVLFFCLCVKFRFYLFVVFP